MRLAAISRTRLSSRPMKLWGLVLIVATSVVVLAEQPGREAQFANSGPSNLNKRKGPDDPGLELLQL